MASTCGSLVPRLGGVHGVLSAAEDGVRRSSSAACSASTHEAQRRCAATDSDASEDNAYCVSLLEAVPRASDASDREGDAKPAMWAEMGLVGAVPESTLCGGGAAAAAAPRHVDLRDNHLTGTIPACVSAAGAGRAELLLSRNRLVGSVGHLSDRHTHVMLAGNHLEGTLDDALTSGKRLHVLDVAGNRLAGSLSAARGHPELRHLHVRDNKFTDSASEPIAAVVASLPRLQSYDIGKNNFTRHGARAASAPLGSAAAAAKAGGASDTKAEAAPSRVHVVLRLSASGGGGAIGSFCPHCATGAAAEHNCGAVAACRARPHVLEDLVDAVATPRLGNAPRDVVRRHIVAHVPGATAGGWGDADRVAALECELRRRAVAEANAVFDAAAAAPGDDAAGDEAEDGDFDVHLERIFPFEGETIASLTIRVAPHHHDQPERNLILARAALSAARAIPAGKPLRASGVCATSARADELDVAGAIHLGRVESVAARPGCTAGHFGAKCQYFCAGKWERASMRVYAESKPDYRSVAKLGGAEDHDVGAATLGGSVKEDGIAVDKAEPRHVVFKDADADAAAVLNRHNVYVRPSGFGALSSSSDGSSATVRRGRVIAARLTGCTSSCRGHASLALETCDGWLKSDKSDEGTRGACEAALADVRAQCGAALADASDDDNADDDNFDACRVSGVVRYFEQHHGLADPATSSSFSRAATTAVARQVRMRDDVVRAVDPAPAAGSAAAAVSAEDHDADVVRRGAAKYGGLAGAASAAVKHALAQDIADHAAVAAVGEETSSDAFDATAGLADTLAALGAPNLHAVVDAAARRAVRAEGAVEPGAAAVNDDDDNVDDIHDVPHTDHGVQRSRNPRESTMEGALRSQFPTCHAEATCPAPCKASMDRALDVCIAHLEAEEKEDEEGVDDEEDKTTHSVSSARRCAAALSAGRRECAAAPAHCYDSVAEGFHGAGVLRNVPTADDALTPLAATSTN